MRQNRNLIATVTFTHTDLSIPEIREIIEEAFKYSGTQVPSVVIVEKSDEEEC